MGRRTHVEETIKSNGESSILKKSYSVKSKVPRFVMLFMEEEPINLMMRVEKLIDFKLLILLCRESEFNKGIVDMSSYLRATLEDELGINKSAFSQAKRRLVDLGLISVDRNRYTISDKVVWKGEAVKWENKQVLPEEQARKFVKDPEKEFNNDTYTPKK